MNLSEELMMQILLFALSAIGFILLSVAVYTLYMRSLSKNSLQHKMHDTQCPESTGFKTVTEVAKQIAEGQQGLADILMECVEFRNERLEKYKNKRAMSMVRAAQELYAPKFPTSYIDAVLVSAKAHRVRSIKGDEFARLIAMGKVSSNITFYDFEEIDGEKYYYLLRYIDGRDILIEDKPSVH